MDEGVVRIGSSADIVTARQRGRALAAGLGFSGSDLTEALKPMIGRAA